MPTYDYSFFINASIAELTGLLENAVWAVAENAANHISYREDVIEWRAIGSNPSTPPPIPPGHIAA